MSAAELFDLTGKVALVTGGSRGLGREMVRAFATAGADVVITSRKLDACEAAAEEVRGLGRRALPVAAHVGHWADLERLTEAAYAEFGRVDVLVNNAGMSPLAPSSERPPAPCGNFPLGELCTLAGIILIIVGFVSSAEKPLSPEIAAGSHARTTISPTPAGIAPDPIQWAASRYVFPAERSEGATSVSSNHG